MVSSQAAGRRRLGLLCVLAAFGLLLVAGNADAQQGRGDSNPPANGSRPATDPALLQPNLYTQYITPDPNLAKGYEGPYSFNLPAGFQMSVFASGLSNPRMITVGACGDLFVGTSSGTIYRLPDRDGDHIADTTDLFASGLPEPAHSVEYWNARYYVGATSGVYRFDQSNCGNGTNQTLIASYEGGGGHSTRTVVHGPDGKMYVSSGSTCNVCIESNPERAAVMRFDSNGGNKEIFAGGLRNDVGLAFRLGPNGQPINELWSSENGRDWLSNNEGPQAYNNYPPEEINIVRQGQYYGWPFCFADRRVDRSQTGTNSQAPPTFPNIGGKTLEQYCAASTRPAVQMQAHMAPMALMFSQYSTLAFPQQWKKGLFIALRGSWNSSTQVGYKVAYIPYFAPHGGGSNWNPPTIDFLTANPRDSLRPVGLVIGSDGALYVSNQTAGAIYRITYTAQGGSLSNQ